MREWDLQHGYFYLSSDLVFALAGSGICMEHGLQLHECHNDIRPSNLVSERSELNKKGPCRRVSKLNSRYAR